MKKLLGLCGLGLALGAGALRGQPEISSPSGLTLRLDAADGHYALRAAAPGWTFAGMIGRPVTDVKVARGRDRLGAFQEMTFAWTEDGAPLAGGIRVYDAQPLALFTLTCATAREKPPAAMLPDFTAFPAGLHHFSYKEAVFAPPSFRLEPNGTPWLLFDDRANAVILSPASDFLLARMTGDGAREIASGLNAGVRGLPAGFTHTTLLAFGRGLNATWDLWGRALTELDGVTRPGNDADIGLRYLGYWTDNGATYYYRYDPALGYAGTLEKLTARYRRLGIPIRYLQLDSWWYEKTLDGPDGRHGKTKNPKLPAGEWNRYGGLLKYAADPALFPDGLAAFHRKIGLPFITHNRWIDRASPYHERYQISGVAAVDPRWWDDIIGYAADSGVVAYEQDWLNKIYQYSPALGATPGAGDAFTGGMARACAARGLDLQYCMALPRFFLQGARYANLTTIRVSNDRFQRSRWDDFLYTSRLASALGIWPWSDVFMSGETDNLRIATLSGGMVGIGDEMGKEDRANIRRAVRADGMIVKPDAPLVPADAMYLATARGEKDAPMIAWTRTDHGALRTVYVFAYNRRPGAAQAGFTPADFGLAGEVYVYDAKTGAGRLAPANARDEFALPDRDATAYFVLAPLGRAGIAFIGDEGKFVTAGRQRIAALADASDGLTATVLFAAGEKSVRLIGYARGAPRAEAKTGAAGAVAYDAASGRFSVDVSPAAAVEREIPGGDPIRRAVIVLKTN